MDRIILHIDMDAFFASIEENDKPRLKGLPIVVGADPNEGKGRGVVSTANYAARVYGIHSAQPISTAWRLSEKAASAGKPRAVFLDVNMRRYAEISHAIMDYLRTQGDVVEQASVDEAYVEMRDEKGEMRNEVWERAKEKAQKIKAHIKKEFGLTCSIGIGPNKLISKIAAGTQKPDGLTVVQQEQVQEFLDPMPASTLPGIGPKSTAALQKIGIVTIQDLRKLSREKLHELFGKWGLSMYDKARGIDESPILAEYEAKSIGEQETFEVDSLDPVFLLGRLKALTKSVHERLLREAKQFKTISIVVRFEDFETLTRAHSLDASVGGTKSGIIIEREALQLFMPFLDRRENPRHKRIRLLGVRIEKLQ